MLNSDSYLPFKPDRLIALALMGVSQQGISALEPSVGNIGIQPDHSRLERDHDPSNAGDFIPNRQLSHNPAAFLISVINTCRPRQRQRLAIATGTRPGRRPNRRKAAPARSVRSKPRSNR